MHHRKKQSMLNLSAGSEFLLLEFSEVREMQLLHAFSFLVFYLATVTGNLLIISAVIMDHHLHVPMYFFVMNLAMLDVGLVTVTIPKSMVNSFLNTRHISYSGCVLQGLLFLFFFLSDFFLLTVMAYDRYVAICNPLQYEMVMNRQACVEMLASVLITSLLLGIVHAVGTFSTPLCSNVVNQFYCEIPQLLNLSCSGVNIIEIGAVAICIVIALGCFLFVILTYVHIFSAVLRIPSVQGRQKVFSTCLPHLIVFCTFLFTAVYATLNYIFNITFHLNLLFAVMYSMVPPLLNPLIYSMRNKDVKLALQKLFCLRNSSKTTFFCFI